MILNFNLPGSPDHEKKSSAAGMEPSAATPAIALVRWIDMNDKALSELPVGTFGTISGYVDQGLSDADQRSILRLMELGFLPSGKIQVVLEAPFSRDPIAVEVRGKKIALRRHDARLILVKECK